MWCESRDLTLFTQTVNVSATGVFVRVPQPLPEGTVVQLRFPDVGVTFQSEVVWSRSSTPPPPGERASDHPGMGLRFLDDGDGREAYEALLARLTAAHDRDPITGKLPTTD